MSWSGGLEYDENRCCEQVQSLSDLDCRGEKMANGGTVIKVRDDFTKCNMLVEEVKDYDQDGNLYVTDYKFTNHLIHDAGQDSVSNTMFGARHWTARQSSFGVIRYTAACFVSL